MLAWLFLPLLASRVKTVYLVEIIKLNVLIAKVTALHLLLFWVKLLLWLSLLQLWWDSWTTIANALSKIVWKNKPFLSYIIAAIKAFEINNWSLGLLIYITGRKTRSTVTFFIILKTILPLPKLQVKKITILYKLP